MAVWGPSRPDLSQAGSAGQLLCARAVRRCGPDVQSGSRAKRTEGQAPTVWREVGLEIENRGDEVGMRLVGRAQPVDTERSQLTFECQSISGRGDGGLARSDPRHLEPLGYPRAIDRYAPQMKRSAAGRVVDDRGAIAGPGEPLNGQPLVGQPAWRGSPHIITTELLDIHVARRRTYLHTSGTRGIRDPMTVRRERGRDVPEWRRRGCQETRAAIAHADQTETPRHSGARLGRMLRYRYPKAVGRPGNRCALGQPGCWSLDGDVAQPAICTA
jgi:hypothetical protein